MQLLANHARLAEFEGWQVEVGEQHPRVAGRWINPLAVRRFYGASSRRQLCDDGTSAGGYFDLVCDDGQARYFTFVTPFVVTHREN